MDNINFSAVGELLIVKLFIVQAQFNRQKGL